MPSSAEIKFPNPGNFNPQMQVMIAVVENEFTKGFLHVFSPLLCFSKRWINFGGEYKAEEHHWTHTCTFPVCAVISESRAVQTAQSTLSFSLCPFVSYYTGKWALSRDWREARPQWGRKEAAESHAVTQQPGLKDLMVLAGKHSQGAGWVWNWLWRGGAHPRAAIFHPHLPYGSALPD